MPALRERREDIAPLAARFIAAYAEQNQRPVEGLSNESLAALERYNWPGNVRELRNAVTRAAVYSSGDEIGPAELPREIIGKIVPAPRMDDANPCSLDGLEQHTIYKVLEQTGGHQQKAAEILGISRRTLIRKLKLYRGEPCESVA
jgi:two-component system response regulator HydG